MLGTYHLNALFEVLNRIHSLYSPEELWKYVLEESCKTLQSTAGIYYQISPDEKCLRPFASHGMDFKRLSESSFAVGVGLSGWVAQYQQPLLIPDVRQEKRFHRQVELLTGFQTKSALAIPVYSQKRLYGVVEILNRKSGQFTLADQEFMVLLGRQTAAAYENWILFAEVSSTKVLLESLLDTMSGGLIAVDKAGVITLFNPAAGRLLQMETNLARRLAKLVFAAVPWVEEILRTTIATGSTVSRQEVILTIGHEPLRFGYTTNLICNKEKSVLGASIIFQKLP